MTREHLMHGQLRMLQLPRPIRDNVPGRVRRQQPASAQPHQARDFRQQLRPLVQEAGCTSCRRSCGLNTTRRRRGTLEPWAVRSLSADAPGGSLKEIDDEEEQKEGDRRSAQLPSPPALGGVPPERRAASAQGRSRHSQGRPAGGREEQQGHHAESGKSEGQRRSARN